MPLTDHELNSLLAFIGYGTLDADIWFLGMEEAGGGEENIRIRVGFEPVEDCAEAHRKLGVTNLHWGKRKIQRTWRSMCYIMLALDGHQPRTKNIRSYQAERLGRIRGNTLLTELMPIPKSKISQCGYEDLLPQFSSRKDYYEQVKPGRIQYLQGILVKHSPKVVIGYGKAFWSAYKELFPEMKFSVRGGFEVGKSTKTLAIMTGHFTARSMNGRLDEVVSIVEQESVLSFSLPGGI
jgi:hypothetical protein